MSKRKTPKTITASFDAIHSDACKLLKLLKNDEHSEKVRGIAVQIIKRSHEGSNRSVEDACRKKRFWGCVADWSGRLVVGMLGSLIVYGITKYIEKTGKIALQ